MNSNLIGSGALCLILFATTVARADEQAKSDQGFNSLTDAALVERLGDRGYAERERATQELKRRGRAALAAVRSAAESENPEIRWRGESLLRLAERSDSDILLEEFLQGKDVPKAAIPGWPALSKLFGGDRESREVYLTILRGDRPFLEKLDRDPKALAAEFNARLERSISRRSAPAESSPFDLFELLFLANSNPLDPQATNRFFSLLFLPNTQATITGNRVATRQLEQWFESKLGEPNTVQLILGVVRRCGCNDLIERRLKPDALRVAKEAASNPLDSAKFYLALAYARQLNMPTLVEGYLKPAVRKVLQEESAPQSAAKAYNLDRIEQIVNLAYVLGDMQIDLRIALGPVVIDALETLDINNGIAFSRLQNLATSAGRMDLFREKAASKVLTVIQNLARPDANVSFGDLWEIYRKAQAVGVGKAYEDLLRPVLARLAERVARTGSPANMREVLTVAQLTQSQLAVQPAARMAVERFCSNPGNLADIAIAFECANILPERNLVETKIKPAAEKVLSAKDLVIDGEDYASVGSALQFLLQLQPKGSVRYAVKAVGANGRFADFFRGQAISVIAQLAGPDDVAEIEPLIANASPFGVNTVDGKVIFTQFGDVLLARVVSLTKQNPVDYGFTFVGLPVNQWGFESAEKREAAIKKWRAWREQQSVLKTKEPDKESRAKQ